MSEFRAALLIAFQRQLMNPYWRALYTASLIALLMILTGWRYM